MISHLIDSNRLLISKNHGSMAVDFLFAFTLIFGFLTLLFSVAMTLTAVEMTQYMTFAAARKLHASHISPEKQSESALNKYQQILNSEEYTMIRAGGWFEVFENPLIGNASENPQLSAYDQGGNPNLFNGVVTLFTAKILSFGMGSFGETTPDDDPGDGSSFATHIGSYLGREPSSQECLDFNEGRWEAIRQLRNPSGVAPYTTGTSAETGVVISDNGC